jgi:hypothetical protein
VLDPPELVAAVGRIWASAAAAHGEPVPVGGAS